MSKWYPINSGFFTIDGLPWIKENDGKLIRFPNRAKSLVPPIVWTLSLMPSGGCIRFRSNTESLQIRVAHSFKPEMIDMSPMAHSGIDLYVQEAEGLVYWGTSVPQFPDDKEAPYTYHFFQDLKKEERGFTLYLPTYNDLVSLEIGLDPDAAILSPCPHESSKPIVFYGSSITQGACASRPGNGYVSLLSRELKVETVNLGFNGSGRGDLSVCDLMAEIDAACYVLDFHVNLPTYTELAEVYSPFYRRLRQKKPNTPILLLSPLGMSCEWFNRSKMETYEGMRLVIKGIYEDAIREGDQHVYWLDGSEIIDKGEDGMFVDGLHPGDHGFYRIASKLNPILRKIVQSG